MGAAEDLRDLRRSFDAANPNPVAYLEAAQDCLDLAKEAIAGGKPLDAKAWLETAREALRAAFELEGLKTP